MTVHHYINARRTETMRAMIERGASLSAVAQALGFRSLSAFSRWKRARS